MCLAVPGKVLEIQGDDPLLRCARVSFAGVIKNTMLVPQRGHDNIAANVTLATLKAGDTLESLMLRVMGSLVVAAE